EPVRVADQMIIPFRGNDRGIVLVDDDEARIVQPSGGIVLLPPSTAQFGFVPHKAYNRLCRIHSIWTLPRRTHPVIARLSEMAEDIAMLTRQAITVISVYRGFDRLAG